MFSVPDILVVSVLALLLFGPDRLPKLMRQAGRFMREVQNTSHSFVSEMERAADLAEHPVPPAPEYPAEPHTIEHEAEAPVEHEAEEPAEHEAEVPIEREERVEHDEPAEHEEPAELVIEHEPLDAEGHPLPGRSQAPFSGG